MWCELSSGELGGSESGQELAMAVGSSFGARKRYKKNVVKPKNRVGWLEKGRPHKVKVVEVGTCAG